MYADIITDSIRKLLKITGERREKQIAFNQEHGIVPKTIIKAHRATIEEAVFGYSSDSDSGKEGGILTVAEGRARYSAGPSKKKTGGAPSVSPLDLTDIISELEREMLEAAESLEFERAAELRDKIRSIEKGNLKIG